MKAFLILFIAWILLSFVDKAMAGGLPISKGRTIYIPPAFSNKDYRCPEGNQMTWLPTCYDFSITNLSSLPQTVEVTAMPGSYVYVKTNPTMPWAPFNLLTKQVSSTKAPMTFTTQGESHQIAFCVLCRTTACLADWTPDVGGEGGILYPPDLPPLANIFLAQGPYQAPTKVGTPALPVKSEWLSFRAMAIFQIFVQEDRGALVGRLNQRIFPYFPTHDPQCKESWTSPSVAVELNGGRAF